MAKGRKYTDGQKKAYYSGMGYGVAYNGKAIPFKNEANKESFKQGFRKGKKSAEKYPDLKSKK